MYACAAKPAHQWNMGTVVSQIHYMHVPTYVFTHVSLIAYMCVADWIPVCTAHLVSQLA